MNITTGTKLEISFGMPYAETTRTGTHRVTMEATVTKVERGMFRYEVERVVSEQDVPTEFAPQYPTGGWVMMTAEGLKASNVKQL
jgi:hypothetical protein